MAKSSENRVKDRIYKDLERSDERRFISQEEKEQREKEEEEWQSTADPEDEYYAHQRKVLEGRRATRKQVSTYGDPPDRRKKGKGKGKGKKGQKDA